ncbi:hypothetical protein MtrunA17_Chr8g0391101 [Medicago truncatula]|uniref:Uncharacterized protein n=1 Tax=Medicago truncatula TaxID=3880 RepID=A0A396GY30_MEDTR|nr:hypothetical protein MtrunA17_Chr8g0391101 [Medicago truncatula]
MAFGQIMDLVTYFRTSKMFSAKSALWGPLNGRYVGLHAVTSIEHLK